MSFKNWVSKFPFRSFSSATPDSESSEDDNEVETSRSPSPGNPSEHTYNGDESETDDVVDITAYLGQQGLVRTTKEPDSGLNAMAGNSGVGSDIPSKAEEGGARSSAIANKDREEKDKETAFLRGYLYAVKNAEGDILDSGKDTENLINICEFPPQDLLKFRQKLEGLSREPEYESWEREKIRDFLDAQGTAKVECRQLILDQLYRRLQKSMEQEEPANEAEDQDIDHPPYIEPIDNELVSDWLWRLFRKVQYAADPLEAGDGLEVAILACFFSPDDENDIRERLQNLSDDDLAGDISQHEEDYKECTDLILEQLLRQYQAALQREEDERNDRANEVQSVPLSNKGHLSWGPTRIDSAEADAETSYDSEPSNKSEDEVELAAKAHGNAESHMLRRMLRSAQSTKYFKPGKSVYQMIEMCDFPPKEDLEVQVRLRSLFMANFPSSGDDDAQAKYLSDQKTAKDELKSLVVNQLHSRYDVALAKLRAARSAARIRKASSEENAVEARKAGKSAMPMSPVVGRNQTSAPLDNHPVRHTRAGGISFVNRFDGAVGAVGSLLSSSYKKLVPDSQTVPKLKPGELPLIMALDGPVNVYQDEVTGEAKIAYKAEQALIMAAFSHRKEVFELKQQYRAQKLYYDAALAKDPTNRKAMETDIFNKAINYLRKATVDTILTRCLVDFFLKDYKVMEAHATASADTAEKIRDKILCIRCAYTRGVALYNQGEDRYAQAYASFDKAQDYPGVYKISDKPASDWKRILGFLLQGTSSARNIPRPRFTYADTSNPDIMNAMARSNRNAATVQRARQTAAEPSDPGNTSKSSSPQPGSDEADRHASTANQHDDDSDKDEDEESEDDDDDDADDGPFPPADANKTPNAPTTLERTSQASPSDIPNNDPTAPNRPHRPTPSPIAILSRPARLGRAARPTEAAVPEPNQPALPTQRPRGPRTGTFQIPLPRVNASDHRNIDRGPRLPSGSHLRNANPRTFTRPNTEDAGNFGESSVPRSALESFRRKHQDKDSSLKSAPGSPSSELGTPNSLAFEADIMSRFGSGGGVGGQVSSAENSFVPQERQGRRGGRPRVQRMSSESYVPQERQGRRGGRPRVQRMSSESVQRDREADWRRRVLKEEAREKEVRKEKKRKREVEDQVGITEGEESGSNDVQDTGREGREPNEAGDAPGERSDVDEAEGTGDGGSDNTDAGGPGSIESDWYGISDAEDTGVEGSDVNKAESTRKEGSDSSDVRDHKGEEGGSDKAESSAEERSDNNNAEDVEGEHSDIHDAEDTGAEWSGINESQDAAEDESGVDQAKSTGEERSDNNVAEDTGNESADANEETTGSELCESAERSRSATEALRRQLDEAIERLGMMGKDEDERDESSDESNGNDGQDGQDEGADDTDMGAGDDDEGASADSKAVDGDDKGEGNRGKGSDKDVEGARDKDKGEGEEKKEEDNADKTQGNKDEDEGKANRYEGKEGKKEGEEDKEENQGGQIEGRKK